MIFLIKSTICLLTIFILYKVFLAKENTPVFKRYFLLFGVVFSIIISLIEINVNVPMPETLNQVTITQHINEINTDNTEAVATGQSSFSYLKWTLYSIYILVFALLLFRYSLNIRRLINLSKKNKSYEFDGYKIVIIGQNLNPYSFLKAIYMNEKDFNNGAVRKEILIHELAHIKERHSLDILFIELLQVIFWFNPLFFLYKKEIRLNHEYLADRRVVNSDIEIHDYQNFMLSVAFRNNSSYLASNLNYSFIKKRFIMLTKKKSPTRAFIKKSVCVPIIMLLAVAISFNMGVMAQDKDPETEWWKPIMEKHGLKMKGTYNNFENVFETSDHNSINDGISISSDALLIIGEKEDYFIVEAGEVIHNLKDGSIKFQSLKDCTLYQGTNEPITIMGDSLFFTRSSDTERAF